MSLQFEQHNNTQNLQPAGIQIEFVRGALWIGTHVNIQNDKKTLKRKL